MPKDIKKHKTQKQKQKPKQQKQPARRYKLTKKLSDKQYKTLIQKKKHHTLTNSQSKKLDRELFINYCKCLKRLTYDSSVKQGLAYPVCISSIYKNRGFVVPRGITKRCKRYK